MTFSDANDDKPKNRENLLHIVTNTNTMLHYLVVVKNREKTEETNKNKTKQTEKYITKKDNRLEMDYTFSS